VLAGGQSRRFGSDKALALLDGKPLIEHAIAALVVRTEAVIVCGREHGDWVPDRPEPGLGPLGGICAALHAAAERGYGAVLTAPCDVPWLPELPFEGAGYAAEMPVIGLWSAGLAPGLDAFLAEGDDRAVRRWAREAGVPAVSVPGLANFNTPGDLDAYRR
jgi:molybdopterin-guanine dinucleotide biosynthesis protein A